MEFIIDAKNKPLGRVATEVALLLQGKHTPKYQPNRAGGDKVIVKNIKEVKVTGNKYEGKIYYRHTGYMGHLKSRTFKEAFEKDPGWVLRHAVLGMLPKNFLKDKRIKRLAIQ